MSDRRNPFWTSEPKPEPKPQEPKPQEPKPEPEIKHGDFEKRDDHSRVMRPITPPGNGDDD